MCTAAESQLKLQSITDFQKLRTFWWAVGCPKKIDLQFGLALLTTYAHDSGGATKTLALQTQKRHMASDFCGRSVLMGHPTAHQKVLSLSNSMTLCSFSWHSKTFSCSAHCSTLMQELTRCYIYISASYLLCLKMDLLQLHVCRRPDEGDSQ